MKDLSAVWGGRPNLRIAAQVQAAVLAFTVLTGVETLPLRADEPLAAYRIDGDAILDPLDGRRGDAVWGQRIVRDREVGNCLICHTLPIPEERFQGELGPDLAGVAGRLSAGQIRLRLVDQTRIDPATIMPPYYRTDGLNNVARRYRARPVLNAQEIEDVIAYLMTLRE
ncbi:MAG: sulfur oxidation c-type cytochrome SoxX [Hyphomicrobiaceae bacterium]